MLCFIFEKRKCVGFFTPDVVNVACSTCINGVCFVCFLAFLFAIASKNTQNSRHKTQSHLTEQYNMMSRSHPAIIIYVNALPIN